MARGPRSSSGRRKGRRKVTETRHSGMLWKNEKQLRRKGSNRRGTWGATLTVDNPIGFDLNVMALLELQSILLADHWRDSWQSNKHPKGVPMESLAPLDEDTKDGSYGPRKGSFFNQTGKSADHVWLGSIRGSTIKASRLIKPGMENPEHEWLFSAWHNRNIDITSVRGKAAEVLEDAAAYFMRNAIGGNVGTKENPSRTETRLNKIGKIPEIK